MMTRRQQIRRALKIIDPPRGQGEAAARQVEEMLDMVEASAVTAEDEETLRSHPGRKKLERFLKLMGQMRDAHKALRLEPSIEIAKALLAMPPRDRAPAPETKARTAVMVAWCLLHDFEQETACSRGSQWDRLAKVMNNSGTDLFEVMRKWRKFLQTEARPNKIEEPV